jgi:surface antigen
MLRQTTLKTGPLSLAIITVWSILLSGCLPQHTQNSTDIINAITLPPAPLPTYTTGTRYVYSNGTWEEVSEVKGGTITWTNHKGNIKKTTADFTRRSSDWETSKRKGYRSIESVIYPFGSQSRTLWPLQTGKTVNYKEEGIWKLKGGIQKRSQAFWKCSVKGAIRISVIAGEFDTWKILCTKYKNEEKSISSSPREYKTFYYSPKVGHWVRTLHEYQSNMDKQDKLKELVAIIPNFSNNLDRDAQKHLELTFQQALEKNKRGQAVSWKRKKDRLSVETVPLVSYWKNDKTVCRQYIQRIQSSNTTQEYFGIACRDAKGIWKIPKR